MIDEIVIDTNVLAHCYNPNEERCEYALELVQRIIAGNEVMCIDAGFDVVESRNRSVIGGEYLRNVRVGTPGYALITTLATTGRIRLLPARPQQAVYRQIMRLIRNKGDRVFVGVAHATFDKVLVSHDFTDFDTAKRSQIRRTLGVDIIEADECCNRLWRSTPAVQLVDECVSRERRGLAIVDGHSPHLGLPVARRARSSRVEYVSDM